MGGWRMWPTGLITLWSQALSAPYWCTGWELVLLLSKSSQPIPPAGGRFSERQLHLPPSPSITQSSCIFVIRFQGLHSSLSTSWLNPNFQEGPTWRPLGCIEPLLPLNNHLWLGLESAPLAGWNVPLFVPTKTYSACVPSLGSFTAPGLPSLSPACAPQSALCS